MNKPELINRTLNGTHFVSLITPSHSTAPDTAMSENPIQIVDFTSFLDGSAKQQVADEIFASFKSAGFVYLTNFGLSHEEVQEIFDWVG